ncbi:hypothetical protein [Roseivivax jejudonensis]|uniref:hypothetical protein n=1 Tax=Roseivivax jejudonensis TaxID=1529041 RepID=UPI0013562910|nr:hypothetical protein [Roseivivax jejudonensis]
MSLGISRFEQAISTGNVKAETEHVNVTTAFIAASIFLPVIGANLIDGTKVEEIAFALSQSFRKLRIDYHDLTLLYDEGVAKNFCSDYAFIVAASAVFYALAFGRWWKKKANGEIRPTDASQSTGRFLSKMLLASFGMMCLAGLFVFIRPTPWEMNEHRSAISLDPSLSGKIVISTISNFLWMTVCAVLICVRLLARHRLGRA